VLKTFIRSATLAAVLAGSSVSAFSAPYYEWSTKYPYSGFRGAGKHSVYCDYIKYPKRHCSYKKVCSHGKCWTKKQCRVVGWDYRQSCS